MSSMFVKKSFVVQALAVVTTVGICGGVLAFVQPWRGGVDADGGMTLSAVDNPPAPVSSITVTRTTDALAPSPAPTETVAAKTPAQPQADAQPSPADAPQVVAENTPAPGGMSRVAPAAPVSKSDPIAATLATLPPLVKPAAVAPQAQPDAPDTTAALAAPASGGRMTKQEAATALQPLLSYTVPDSEMAALKEFAKLVYREEYAAARPYLANIKDTAARKLALWYYYRAGASDTAAEDIAAFRENNPLWPSRKTLADRAEDALFWRENDSRRVIAFFRDKQPVSGAGWAALGSASITAGRDEEGRMQLRRAWRSSLTPSVEARIKEKYGAELRPQDHKARIDYLLVQDAKAALPAVERLLPLIDKKSEPQVKACIAAVKREKKASAMLDALSAEAKAEPAVMFIRIQDARRADKDKETWPLLRASPTAPEKLLDPAKWWEERETQIRRALNAGEAKTAYAIARNHAGEPDPDDFADAEYLAGWIALRFLDQPKIARDHFKASAASGGLPSRRARAGYWLGRTELTLNNSKGATGHFAEAAQHSHTFYGQLAHQMIEAKAARHSLRTYVRPTAQEIAAFNKLDVMRALVIANKAGLDSLVPVFLFDLARSINSAPDMVLTAELATRIARPHIAVRMAKIAMNREFPVEHYAYPDSLPEFKALAKDQDLELALIHALTRQESEFNPATVSSAGAVGLMQLLPSTAKEVARGLAVKFEKNRLISDPAYNVSLGSAFLQQLVRSYDGSYIMTLAAYNAGPGRVRQWVALFGDPRDKNVDPIDWVERIPITETREYVHKIMESVQVYRSRLVQKGTNLRLAQDLHRGRPDQPRSMLQLGAQ